MDEYGVPTNRVINAGGISQTNNALNQVYANVLGRPVLVPGGKVTSLGSAIFAFPAAGIFKSVEEAQERVCPPHIVFEPHRDQQQTYNELYECYRRLYFEFGDAGKGSTMGEVLPTLLRIAEKQRAVELKAEGTPA
jgi:L-ribulokinase